MITYGSTTLTSYNSIVKTEVYYYKSTSATSLSGGSWATTKPTWENGKYIWQKIRTVYEDGTHSESDPVNITGQQGATGTAAYSFKLNSSDSIIGKTKDGEYTIKKITFSATYKQGTGAVSAYNGRFKIESTMNGSTWKTEYTSNGNESSKEFTIPDDIIAIKCSLYQSSGTTVLLDIVTVPVVKDGVDAIGLRDSIPYYLASDKDTGVTRLTQGWTRYKPQLTAEKKYLWVYYVSRYSEGSTEPKLIEIKDNLVHFENNGDESPVESCIVDIEPVQDLNGYDHPWVGGGGKNLLPCTMTTKTVNGITFTVKTDGTVTANGTASSTSHVSLEYGQVTGLSGNYYFTGCPSGGKNGTYDVYPWDITTNARPKKWDGSTTATSDYGAFTLQQIQIPEGHELKILLRIFKGQTVNNIVFKPMIVKSTETSTAYEPYENICPITGWTKARATRAGKNLFLPARTSGTSKSNGVAFSYSADGTVTASGTATANAFTTAYDQVGLTFHLPPGRYIKSGASGNFSGILVQYIDPADYSHWVTIGSVGSTSFTITEEQSKCNLIVRVRVASGKTVEDEVYKPYLAFESSGSDYEPYVGQTYDITFPTEAGTVYGGTLDVTKGELVVDRAIITMDGSQQIVESQAKRFYTTIPSAFTVDVSNQITYKGVISDKFRSFSWGGLADASIGCAPVYENGISFKHPDMNTVGDWKTYFTNNPTVFSYELATPITYQLTPQEITMLCKENNIFADTGQTAISYYDNQTSTDPFIDYSVTSAFEYADTAINRATATYGTCSTVTGMAAKVVACPDFVLFNGARIQVTFTNANTTFAPTLNVNSTGAKPIYINKTVTSSSNLLLWTAGSKMEFVYDGTGWVAQNVPYALYGTCSTDASTATKNVTCDEAVICKGTTISVNMTNTNTAANAKMNVGSTVAKDIYANGAKLTTNSRFNWRANTTQKFVFDGQVWRMDDDSVKALATAYITEINNDGIMVHPEDDSTSGWAISDAIQLFKSGISYIKLWIEDTVAKIRIGKEDQGHIILDNDSIDINNGDTNLASFSEQTRIGAENSDKMIISPTEMVGYMSNNQLLYRFYHYNNGSSVAHEITEDNGLMYTQTVPTSKHLEFYYTPKFSPEDNTTVSFTAIIYDVTFKEIYSVADSETYIYEEPEEGAIVDPAWTEYFTPSSGTRPQEDTIIDPNSVGTLIDGYGGCKLGVRFNILQYNYDRISVKFIVTYTTTGMREYRYYTFGDRVDEINAGDMSFIIGNNINASGENSIGLGKDIKSLGVCSYAQGLSTQATADYSYAEGCSTKAQGIGSHAEGISVQANKYASHAEGCHTISNGDYSHAQNYYTTASSHSQTAIGKYNKIDSSNKYALIIGNGNASEKSNALALTWDGNVELFLDVNATLATTDGQLYTVIHALGWDNDVLTD